MEGFFIYFCLLSFYFLMKAIGNGFEFITFSAVKEAVYT